MWRDTFGKAAAAVLALVLAASFATLAACSGGSVDGSSSGSSALDSSSSSVAEEDGQGISEGFLAEAHDYASEQFACQSADPAVAPELLAEAMDTNPDVCAWIYVPGTNVMLPFVQGADDEYYMNHAADGKDSPLGTPFVDSRCSTDFNDAVTVVYGHSFVDEDLAFTQLHKFENRAFFSNHELFYVYLPDGKLSYQIVSACTYNDVDFLEMADVDNSSHLQSYMNLVADPGNDRALSRDVGGLDASSDKILQLVTCTLPTLESVRFVVTGVLLDDETERTVAQADR